MPKRDEDQSILPIMWLLFTFLTIYAPKIIYCIFSLIGRLINRFTHHLVNIGAMIGLPVAILFCISMWWGVIFTRYDIEVEDVTVASEKVPEAFNNYRIVQFSDMHVGTWGNDTAFVSKIVGKINELKPNLIVFTGDIVNRKTEEIEPFVDIFSRLNAPDGVYSIMGNHDYGDYVDWRDSTSYRINIARLKDHQRNFGWKMLNNDYAFINRENDSIVLIGVENWGEPPFKQYGRLEKAYGTDPDNKNDNLNDDRFKILLTHNPEHWRLEVQKQSNIDLSLSGHTHAMQMEFGFGDWKWSPAAWRYKNWGGMYEGKSSKNEPMKLYVNIGAGEVGIPTRIGATPELTVITLKHINPGQEK